MARDVVERLREDLVRDEEGYWVWPEITLTADEAADLLAVVEAAKEYRDISLDEPLSLDRPTAGKKLDAALARIYAEDSHG